MPSKQLPLKQLCNIFEILIFSDAVNSFTGSEYYSKKSSIPL